MSQLAQGKEEEARKSPFMMSLPTLPAVSVLGTLVQKLWAVFCPASERMKIAPSLGGCWNHLLVLILGVSIPRLSPSRTKGMMYHLHLKRSVVAGHWDRRKPLPSSVEFQSPAMLQRVSKALLTLLFSLILWDKYILIKFIGTLVLT